MLRKTGNDLIWVSNNQDVNKKINKLVIFGNNELEYSNNNNKLNCLIGRI